MPQTAIMSVPLYTTTLFRSINSAICSDYPFPWLVNIVVDVAPERVETLRHIRAHANFLKDVSFCFK